MRTRIPRLTPWLIAAAIAATATAGGTKESKKLEISSSEFKNGAPLPRSSTCDGEGKSPALAWRGVDKESKSFALVVDDPDAAHLGGSKGPFVHWLLFDIPKETTSIAHGDNAGIMGLTSADRPGYAPACPPKGSGTHHYRFHLYALDTPQLGLSGGATRADLEDRMRGHVLAESELVGTYQRR